MEGSKAPQGYDRDVAGQVQGLGDTKGRPEGHPDCLEGLAKGIIEGAGEENVILKLLEEKKFLKICAPMVRYSKLPFRNLVRSYGCDVAFSPMIMSDSFRLSEKARKKELTTNQDDSPLVVQFAANKVEDFVESTQLVQNFCHGVDLNCGCPQKWALKEGIGASLINKPEMVAELVKTTKSRCRKGLNVSVKIRIHDDINKTVDFCRKIEACGADLLSVHGRTCKQRSDPVNLEAIQLIKSSLQIPVIANGDVRSLRDLEKVRDTTGVDGVMAARGLLENPAMFDGYNSTPRECIEKWCQMAFLTGTSFTTFHHHLIYMLERSMSRSDRRIFNCLSSTSAVLNFLDDNYQINCFST